MSETEDVEDFGMFEEPEGFRPPSPKPTLTVYKRVKTGEDWKVSLPPRHRFETSNI